MNTKVFSAVLRRNFAGYIANSVNYLVICVFVLLFAVAALWPSESFPSNLHQFDKLFVFWLIMLGLILTLLMRTWAAEPPPEVEQLLCAAPPRDFRVVLGEYLGRYVAAVPGFSVAMLAAVLVIYVLSLLAWASYGAPFVGWWFLASCLGHWLLGLVVLALGLTASPVLRAVFKRNFVAYFANPTGYVFICVFVLLSTVSAFWPNEFFVTNLANLDQLNKMFPLIMLFFIPAVTMAIWADERRQKTDELLLTVPASDLDIVFGKYLAAVAIYSVALLFSLFCNYAVLAFLGDPDTGLFLGTYVGYWLVGLAMLAIGMVASFLTANLTVAYILGAVFNVPLVFAVAADVIASREVALAIKQWSVAEQFRDFGRGIVSLSSLVYFAMLVLVMLYVTMVLIGRRHWGVENTKLSRLVGHLLAALLFAFPMAFLAAAAAHSLIYAWFGGSPAFLLWDLLIALLLAVAYLVGSLVLRWQRPWFQVSLPTISVHYAVRALGLVVIASAVVVLFGHHDLRWDVTRERLSSLSPDTMKLLKNLKLERPVQVEAFVSPTVPEAYVQTRVDLLSMLREMDIRGGQKVQVRVNNTERFSEDAARAEQRYDITPREVTTMDRGSFSRDYLFMGVAFTCGLEKVILPFIDRGIPVEYELVRSIATVTQQERKKVGVVETDAPLYGRFNMQSMSSSSNWPIIDELEKQYEVERVDATNPISDKYDVLLAVQPSSLGPEQMDHFVAAVRSGIPTAIFEDPFPFFAGDVPGTTAPKRPPGGMNPMMMGGQPPQEKGNRAALWDLLKVDFGESQIVWQDYNPYRRFSDWPKEFVFVDQGSGANEPFSESDKTTSGLQHMLFVFPGSLRNLNVSNLKFTPLVATSDKTGTVDSDEVLQFSPFGMMGGINPDRRLAPTGVPYVLAAHIRGNVEADTSVDPHGGRHEGNVAGGDDEGDGDGEDQAVAADSQAPEAESPAENPAEEEVPAQEAAVKEAPEKEAAAEEEASEKEALAEEAPEKEGTEKEAAEEETAEKEAAKPERSGINVILVADIDMLHREFFRLREMGDIPEAGVRFDFDNVTFVLNVLDTLAGDDRFLEIRKRRPEHRTLIRIEERTEKSRKDTAQTIEELRDEYEKVEEEEDKILKDKISKMEERMKKKGGMALFEIANRVGMAQRDGERRKQIKLEQLQKKRDREINRIGTELSLKIDGLQDTYKWWAVLLPPIPPLVVAMGVFFTRRRREREGVARGRLRS